MFELIRRFKRLMAMGLGNVSATKMGIQFVLALCTQTFLLLAHTRVISGMMGCIFSREASRFRTFLRLCAMGLGVSVACALTEQWIGFLKSTFELRLQEGPKSTTYCTKSNSAHKHTLSIPNLAHKTTFAQHRDNDFAAKTLHERRCMHPCVADCV